MSAMVAPPDGPVAIETLREGDLVIGRDEETGQSGVFPVTALMTRHALDVIHLTLEKDGETTRMGVTSQHPLFVAGEGWVLAGELVPGDVVRDTALQTLRVLSVELDSAPTRVHNLEVAGAHTYFAGELEAWGHNAPTVNPFKGLKWYEISDMLRGQGCVRKPGSRKTTNDGVPSEFLSPNGTEFFLDDTGWEPMGDHVDVTPAGCGKSGKFRLETK